MVDEIFWDTESSSASYLQPPSPIEIQIVDEGLEIYNHIRVAAPLSQEYLSLKNAPTHQHDGLHTKFNPLNQSILGLLEDNIAIYDESTSSDDHEEEDEFLSQRSAKLSQVKEEVVLDQAYLENPLSQVLFQDPFADLLEALEEGVKHVKSSLMQNFKNILGTTIRKQVRWKWHFYFFGTLKELKQNPSWNHLLDWLCWKRYFTK